MVARLRGKKGGGSAAPRIPRAEGEAAVRASFAEERLLFLEQLDPGTQSYLLPALFRIQGPLDRDALRGALADLAHRHEALRTSFTLNEGVATRHVASRVTLPLSESDLSDAGPEALDRWIAQEQEKPFDLTSAPLLRAGLARTEDSSHVLVLVIHHIVSDGTSQGILLQELSELYRGRVEGRPASLPAPLLRYADFAAWQRSRAAQAGPDLAYWKQQLNPGAGPGAAAGPSSTRAAIPPRRQGRLPGGSRTDRSAPDPGAGAQRHAVHGSLCCVRAPALPAHRSAGFRHWHAGRGTPAARAGLADGAVRQHHCHPLRPHRRLRFQRAAERRALAHRGGHCAPGGRLRERGGRGPTGARSQPLGAVPGLVCHAARGRLVAHPARLADRAGDAAAARRQVRPDPLRVGDAPGPGRSVRVLHRSVRGLHAGANGGMLHRPAPLRGQRAKGPPGSAERPSCHRAPADAGGLESHRDPAAPGPLRARAVRGTGRAHPGCRGGGLRGSHAHLPRAG